MKIVDLTVVLDENTPVYPGDSSAKIQQTASITEDGFTEHLLTIPTHIGTHIDAPSHMIEESSVNIKDYNLSSFIGEGYLIDIRSGIDGIFSQKPPFDSIILFYTGRAEKYHEEAYFKDYQAMTEEIGDWIIGQKPKAVGFDMSGPDYEPFPVHKILLGAKIPIIENLCNFDKLVDKKFEIIALPIKLNLDGAPARVVAKIG